MASAGLAFERVFFRFSWFRGKVEGSVSAINFPGGRFSWATPITKSQDHIIQTPPLVSSNRCPPKRRNKAGESACTRDPVASTGDYRLLGFISTASAAESLRSRWGSVRRAPVCSSQGSSVAAPQVGQGTEHICFSVSSLVFTAT
jgi:hypothetical protein